jgi:hypothetical protein
MKKRGSIITNPRPISGRSATLRKDGRVTDGVTAYQERTSLEIRSTLSGIYNVLHLFEAMPTSYTRAFLAVAKHENKCVDFYYPGYTLSASGLSSNHQEVVLAKQLSLIRSPDALNSVRNPG